MEIIYILALIHFTSLIFFKKIKLTIFTFLSFVLLIGYSDFFLTKLLEYENREMLLVTFIFTYIVNNIFDYFYNPKIVTYCFKFTKRIYFVYFILIAFRINSFITGNMYGTNAGTNLEVSVFSNLYGTINNLGIFFFILSVILDNKKDIMFFGASESIWYLLGGSKLFIVYVILIYFFNKYQRQEIPFSFLYKMLLVVVVFPYFFILAWNFRINTRTGKELNYETVKSLVLLENQIVDNIPTEIFIERYSTSYFYDKFISYSDKNPVNEYSSGYHFVLPLLWYIPRSIWEDKPKVSYGEWVGKKVYGWKLDTRSEAAVSLWGDFYNPFGVFGVLIGVLFLNCTIFLMLKIIPNQGFIALYTLSIIQRLIFSYEQNFNAIVIHLFYTFILTYILYKTIFKNVFVHNNKL